MKKLLGIEVKKEEPCSFNQFCLRHDVDFTLLRRKFAELGMKLDAAHDAGQRLRNSREAASIADRLIVEAKAMRQAGIGITRRGLAKRVDEGRNNDVFVRAWALATAPDRPGRLGGKTLPLARWPARAGR